MLISFRKSWIVVLFSVFILYGCSSEYSIDNTVDARALSNISSYKNYWILPGSKSILATSLAFIDYSKYVESLLSELGYTRAASEAEADLVIFLSYQIGEPRTYLYADSEPVWWQNDPFYNQDCFNCWPMPIYQNTVYSEDVYNMSLRLDAYNGQAYFKQKQLLPLWSVHDAVVSRSGDLRGVFPYMLAAVAPYIGKDSGVAIKVSIKTSDPQARQLIEAQKIVK